MELANRLHALVYDPSTLNNSLLICLINLLVFDMFPRDKMHGVGMCEYPNFERMCNKLSQRRLILIQSQGN